MVYHARAHGGWRGDPGEKLCQSPGVDPIDKVYQEQITRSEPCYQEREPSRPPSD